MYLPHYFVPTAFNSLVCRLSHFALCLLQTEWLGVCVEANAISIEVENVFVGNFRELSK